MPLFRLSVPEGLYLGQVGDQIALEEVVQRAFTEKLIRPRQMAPGLHYVTPGVLGLPRDTYVFEVNDDCESGVFYYDPTFGEPGAVAPGVKSAVHIPDECPVLLLQSEKGSVSTPGLFELIFRASVDYQG